LTKPENIKKTEAHDVNSRDKCTEKCRNHKQSQAVISMLQAIK